MTDLRDRLQQALGAGYRVEKELGGGGMSRVFLAEEVRLGRRVVVKVLPPEMAAGVSVDRFEREIQLAAKLQHPHVVPLLTAGSADDLLYYIMPFIEGESLRAKLAREGELPIPDGLRILRDVLDALAYAHRNHVVHRDIKPDNVLLSEGHALVTDFGVAKAVAESTGKHTLTSMGVALGTPAYMAPEQATADPHTDHRADIYAVGAMAYEMLSGRPPFMAMNAQAMLAAHVTEAPEPVTKHRDTVPEALNQLILRCLAKKPADRWQRADELIPQVAALLTPTGGTTPTGTQPVLSSGTQAAIDRAHPVRVAGLFGLASVGVLAIVYAVVQLAGLPDWVFYGAIGLLAIGLPIMLVTGHHERRRAIARSSGRMTATPAGGLAPHFTWRKALMGGGIGFASLGVVSAGYMAMRLLGIGPAGTLVAKGTLAERDRLILVDFENATGDTTVSETVTELLRIDLAQSPVVTVLEPRQVGDVLERMQRDRTTRLTPELAQEVAEREGIKAYLTGEIRSAGSGYLVSVRLIQTSTGDALVTARETAKDGEDLIPVMDRLSGHLRERFGESLRTVRADPPLDQLTTGSLEALRMYAQANRFFDAGDNDRGIALLEQAVAADTTFATAYRSLGTRLGNRGSIEQGEVALRRAYALRGRVSDRERYHIEGIYFSRVERDYEKAVTAYLTVLEKYPDDPIALNNLAVSYGNLGRWAERNAVSRRAVDARVASALGYQNLTAYLLNAGDVAGADTILRLLVERFPGNALIPDYQSRVALARHDFPQAEAKAREMLSGPPALRQIALGRLAQLDVMHGRLAQSDRQREEAGRILGERTGAARREEQALFDELFRIQRALRLGLGDPADLARPLEGLWRRNAALFSGRPAPQRGYEPFIGAFARAGQAGRARQLLQEYQGALTERDRAAPMFRTGLQMIEAAVLLAENRALEAAALFRRGCEMVQGGWAICSADPAVGEAYDRAGQLDSALAIYERYLRLEATANVSPDYAPLHRRVGEIYEQRGERQKAIDYYSRFAELWKDADPELQPFVADVKGRMARLVGERK